MRWLLQIATVQHLNKHLIVLSPRKQGTIVTVILEVAVGCAVINLISAYKFSLLCPSVKKSKYFTGCQFITSRNLSNRLCIVIVKRKLMLVTVLRHLVLFNWQSFVWTQEKDIRIIIGNFDERSARKVFCQVRHRSKCSWSNISLCDFIQEFVVKFNMKFFFCKRYDQPCFSFQKIARNTFYLVRQRLASPKTSFFPTAYVFRVTWSERGFGGPFVSHMSTKCIDWEGQGRRLTGTRLLKD